MIAVLKRLYDKRTAIFYNKKREKNSLLLFIKKRAKLRVFARKKQESIFF
jgi:hypothetical protein